MVIVECPYCHEKLSVRAEQVREMYAEVLAHQEQTVPDILAVAEEVDNDESWLGKLGIRWDGMPWRRRR